MWYVTRLSAMLFFLMLSIAALLSAPAIVSRLSRPLPSLSTAPVFPPVRPDAVAALDGTRLVLRSGAPVRESPHIRGLVEKISIDGNSVRILGWATDSWSAAAASSVLAFAAVNQYSTLPSVPRPDVARVFREPGSVASGFEMAFETPASPKADALRIFACDWIGGCAELPVHRAGVSAR